MKRSPFFFLSVMIGYGLALMAGDNELFKLGVKATLKTSDNLPIAHRVAELMIDLDVGLVTSNPDEVMFALPDGSECRAVRVNFEYYDLDWVAWSGTVVSTGEELEGYLFLNYFQGGVSGVLHSGGNHYNILPGRNETHRLVRVEGSAMCPVEAAKGVTGGAIVRRDKGGESAIARGGDVMIDVMALYQRDFLDSAGLEQDTRAFITTAFGMANDLFKMSGINIRYRLVYLGPNPTHQPMLPSGPEEDGDLANKAVSLALDYLNGEPSAIADLREGYGADMVALFVPLVEDLKFDICGVANLPILIGNQEMIEDFDGDEEPFNSRAFIALEVGCGQTDFTYAHEHGHNLSMSHDLADPNVSDDRIFEYGVGYVFNAGGDDDVATVMGCNRVKGGSVPDGVCNRIPHFSNPNVSYMGFPTGVPGNDGADNARVANDRAASYANFLLTVTNATPSLTITGPADGAIVNGGVAVNFTATATDAEDGNLTQSVQWRSDVEPIAGTGSPFATPLFVMGQQVITASVVDSGGKLVEKSIRIQVQSGEPEIRVRLVGGGNIADGGSFSFPATSVDDLPISREFSVCNDGPGGLLLTDREHLVSGAGFTQIGPLPDELVAPGNCTNFRVRFHVANPGPYTGAITIANNDSNENPYNIALAGTAQDSFIQLVASYIPHLNQPRTLYRSSSENPPSFDFFYDPNLGNFEERPGGICNHGQNNPTYLKLSLGGSVLNTGGIDGCSYTVSFNGGSTIIPCSQALVDDLNEGVEVIIATDQYVTDTNTCDEVYPLQTHVGVFEEHWLEALFVVGNESYPRRVNFRRSSQVRRIDPEADTFVSASPGETTLNFGTDPQLKVRNVSTQAGKYGFARFRVPLLLSDLASARLHLKVLGNPISLLNLHDVCGNNWNETTLTWDDWYDQTGGSCGVIQTLTNLPANRKAVFNVDGFAFNGGSATFGFETYDTADQRRFGSREASSGADRPVLLLTYQR